MTEVKVQVESVRIEGRYRKDLGDIKALARSIERGGLINAITITPAGRLLAGERRLEAYRLLGRTEIEARVVDTLDDAAEWLRVERDENTERKPMAPSELVALGRALEELERPRAVERRRESGRRAAAKRLGKPDIPSTVSPDTDPDGRAIDVVAQALGTSTMTYYRAKTVVDAVSDPARSEAAREAAREAQADMDSGAATITAAYDRVKSAAPVRIGPIQSTTISSAGAQRRSISSAEAALSGICHGLKQVINLHPDITSEEAAQWVGSLSESRRAIDVLIKRLKERTNAQP